MRRFPEYDGLSTHKTWKGGQHTAQKQRRAVVRVACEEPDALRETVLEVGLAVMQITIQRFP